MIPIHQILIGNRVPRLNRECLESWRQLESRGFEIVAWTDGPIRRYLDRSAPPEVVRLYARARNRGEASDVLRLAIAHSYGGLYVDWDVLLVDPDRFLAVMPDLDRSACILLQDRYTSEPDFERTYDNSLFYLRKGYSLALEFMAEIERSYSRCPVPTTPFLTGPLALTRFLDAYPHHAQGCHVVDTLDVYAFDYDGVMRLTKGETTREVLRESARSDAPAIHFWTHTWPPRPAWPRRVLHAANRIFRGGLAL